MRLAFSEWTGTNSLFFMVIIIQWQLSAFISLDAQEPYIDNGLYELIQ